MKIRGLPLAALFAASLSVPASAQETVPQNDLLNATLWMSNSVEYVANTTALFQLAKMRLDEALADPDWTAALEQTGDYQDLPPAVIVDVDETMLDNDAYESWLVTSGNSYSSKTWGPWVEEAAATAIPGALDFAQYADSKGVKVFYITNRKAPGEEATRKNMEALGFPMGGNVDTFLMRGEKEEWGSAKGSRRVVVARDYRVLVNVGDNWGDFSDDAGGSEAERKASLEANMAHIGHDWIMIANAEYGSFESAPFLGDYSKSPDERRQLKIDALPAWSGPPQQ